MLNHAVMNKKRYQMQFFSEKRLEKRKPIHPTHIKWVILDGLCYKIAQLVHQFYKISKFLSWNREKTGKKNE